MVSWVRVEAAARVNIVIILAIRTFAMFPVDPSSPTRPGPPSSQPPVSTRYPSAESKNRWANQSGQDQVTGELTTDAEDRKDKGFDFPTGEVWAEDDSWWVGAEEIDLTLVQGSFDSHPELDFIEPDSEVDWWPNSSCLVNVSCDVFVDLFPPPDFILSIPPPPMPPFLKGMEAAMHEAERKWEEAKRQSRGVVNNKLEASGSNTQWGRCSLCGWASGGNETISMLPGEAGSKLGMRSPVVGLLVGVALASAALGAALMGILLRCPQIKILPSGGDTCAMLLRGTWVKCSSQSSGRTQGNNEALKSPSQPDPNSRIGWALKFWRRGSSQAPLNSFSSQGSENSYTEEPSMSPDAPSAIYAELTSRGGPGIGSCQIESCRACCLNTYSEIPDPSSSQRMPGRGANVSSTDSSYENAGYFLSEVPSDIPESSVGSTSTPSSAYYSDVSSCEAQTNKKRKKKRKDDKRCNVRVSQNLAANDVSCSVPVISSQIPPQRVHLEINRLHQHHYVPTTEILPMRVQFVPRHLSLERKPVESLTALYSPGHQCPGHDGGRDPHILQGPKVIYDLRPLQRREEFRSIDPVVVLNGIQNHRVPDVAEDHECLEHHYGSGARPLPPLPSRQLSGPQRRNVKTRPKALSAIPSEYV